MNFLTDNNVSLPAFEIAFRLFMTSFLSGFFSIIYLKFKSEESDRRQLAISMVFVAVTIAMILMAVDQSIPRAFGLFAALSIIRFRMPIRNFKDITFLFISIGIGIVCGSGAIKVAIVSTLMIFLIFVTFSYLFSFIKLDSIYHLSIQSKNFDEKTRNSVELIFKNAKLNFKLAESYSLSGRETESVYRIEAQNLNFTELQNKFLEDTSLNITSSRILSKVNPDDLGI